MAITTRRLNRLAATFHALLPLSKGDLLADRISGMTTAERVARLRELTIKALTLDREARLGRPVTADERGEIALEADEIRAEENARLAELVEADWPAADAGGGSQALTDHDDDDTEDARRGDH